MSLAAIKKEIEARTAAHRRIKKINAEQVKLHGVIDKTYERITAAMSPLVFRKILRAGTWKAVQGRHGYERTVDKLDDFLAVILQDCPPSLSQYIAVPKKAEANVFFTVYPRDDAWVYYVEAVSYEEGVESIDLLKSLGVTVLDDRADKIKERLRVLKGDRRKVSGYIELAEDALDALQNAEPSKKKSKKAKKKKRGK